MKHDYSWLDPYAEMLDGKTILELGCGSGLDSIVLARYAKYLISGDLTPNLQSQGSVLAFDHSKKLPFENSSFDTVVASLCLHYFKREKTEEIITEVSRVLKPQGLFIGRVNSYKDENHGSVGYPEIEAGLFSVCGEQKRFFQEQEIRALWGKGYSLNKISHKSIDRYQKPKWVFEFSAIGE